MEGCGTGGMGDGWGLVEWGEEAGEGVEGREGCFIAERRGWGWLQDDDVEAFGAGRSAILVHSSSTAAVIL